MSAAVLAVCLLLPAAPEMPPLERPPLLGVSVEPCPGPIAVGERTFPLGLRISAVTPGSSADVAGVRGDDILVALDDLDFGLPSDELLVRFQQIVPAHRDGDTLQLTIVRPSIERTARLGDEPLADPNAWREPNQILATRPVGTTLRLTAVRRGEVRAITVVLQPRREPLPSHRMPTNEEIAPTPVPHLPEEQLAEALLDHYGAREDYTRLRARLAGLVQAGDPYRLSRVAYALREPMAMPALARDMAALPDDLPGALVHAARWLDRPVDLQRPPQLRTGLTVAEHAGQIAHLLADAGKRYDQAFAGLQPHELEFLIDALPDVAASFREVVMVLVDQDARRLARVRRWAELAHRVDTGALAQAAIVLSALTDADYLDGLRRDLADAPEGIILTYPTLDGPIVLAGRGTSVHTQPAAVLIDLGGDDWYTQETQRPLSVVIDLDGNDTYQATCDGAQGAGLFGIALQYDRAGDDTYIGQHWAQAAAVLGVGVLWDQAGNDTYRANDYAQAAALCGLALLCDDAGDDRYEAPRYAQALGMPGGFAALIDHAGNDSYYCGGRDTTNYGTQGVYDAFCQGCGIGFRNLASGGLAVLRDDGGDDLYYGANFAQGGGYYYGWGVQSERAGNDRYRGARYAQAWAAHQALGYLEDEAGNDFYQCWQAVGQSCAWDEAVTVLIDRAGDDVYTGPLGFSRCAAHNNGWALLLDYAGRDRYEGVRGAPRADGNDQVTSFAGQLDFGGAADEYAGEGLNNALRHGNRHGFLGDLPGDLEAALRAWRGLVRE